MEIVKLEKDKCPICGKELDSATSAHGNDRPSPGDISICIYCATILRFDENLKLGEFPQEELIALPREVLTTINHIKNTILTLNKK